MTTTTTPTTTVLLAEAPGDRDFLDALATTREAERLPGLPEELLALQVRARASGCATAWPAATSLVIAAIDGRGASRPVGRLLVAGDHVVDLVVAPTARRHGHARAALLLWLSDRTGPATLHVEPGSPALGLYLSLGFVVTESTSTQLAMSRPTPEVPRV